MINVRHRSAGPPELWAVQFLPPSSGCLRRIADQCLLCTGRGSVDWTGFGSVTVLYFVTASWMESLLESFRESLNKLACRLQLIQLQP